jgi:tetratricopeptide (TPR) repeat protein
MRKLFLTLLGIVLIGGMALESPREAWAAYNFGDYRSVTLTTKAWKALEAGDLDGVLAYTNKCIELYGAEAKKMQNSLTGYPTGKDEDIFKHWALNDVATSLFIQGEAFRKAGNMDEAKVAYQKLIDNYSYGQAWDPQGWFWKPAEAAQGNLNMLESGLDLDFGDYSSQHLVAKAWGALEEENFEAVNVYVDAIVELYGEKAKEMQNSLTKYPENNETIFSYWALNDVGTALFIKGEAYRRAGDTQKARESFQKLIDEFDYAQCWDPNGWFWKPAEAAQQNLSTI